MIPPKVPSVWASEMQTTRPYSRTIEQKSVCPGEGLKPRGGHLHRLISMVIPDVSLGDGLQSTNVFRGKLLCRYSPYYEFIPFCNVSWASLLDGWLTTIMCNELIFDEMIKYILSAMVNPGKDNSDGKLQWLKHRSEVL